jgi:dTDP-glucose pyrophosphorylase
MNKRFEQAVVFAGGRGERLRPLTDSIPKSMAPVLSPSNQRFKYIFSSFLKTGPNMNLSNQIWIDWMGSY